MFVFIYFLVVTLITAVAPGFLYHPCDPYMANKAGYIYLIASALGHLLLLEAGRLTGLLKKKETSFRNIYASWGYFCITTFYRTVKF